MKKLLVLAALAGVAGCQGKGPEFHKSVQKVLHGDAGKRKQDATPQERGQVVIPTLTDPGAPLALTSSQPKTDYVGTLLFWNPDTVTPPQIAAVATASATGRAIGAQIVDQLQATLPPARRELKLKTALREQAEKAKTDAEAHVSPEDTRTFEATAMRPWFEKRLTFLEGQGVAFDRGVVKEQFARYCEAKLWEFAASPLAVKAYKGRPTPLFLCEDYYASRGYFNTELAVCQPADGVYFDCLWKEGVAKSRMVEQLRAHVVAADAGEATCVNSGAKRAAAIDSWLEPTLEGGKSVLRAVFEDSQAIALGGVPFRQKLITTILGGEDKILGLIAGGAAAQTAYSRALVAARCNEAFFVKSGDRVAAELGTNAAQAGGNPVSLRLLLTIVEAETVTFGDESLFPGYAGDKQDVIASELLLPLRAYSRRLKVADSDLVFSYADKKWNIFRDESYPDGKHQGIEAVEGTYSNVLKGEGACGVIDPAYCAAVDAAKAAEAAAKANLEAAQAAALPLKKQAEDAKGVGTEALSAPGAARYWGSFTLSVGANAAGQLVVGVNVGNLPGKTRVACSDFSDVQSCAEQTADAQFTALRFHPDTGELTVELALTASTLEAFAPKARGEIASAFSELDPAVLEGGRLRLEVYANQLGSGAFRFVTGKAFLLDANGNALEEGSVSADNTATFLSQN